MKVAAEPGDGAALQKSIGLVGPIREVFDAPFSIVYPAGNSSKMRNDRKNAIRIAREWIGFAQGMPDVVADSEVTENHIRDRNLVICGSPDTNIFLARIADRLPIRIGADCYEVGAHSFPSAGCGLQFVYPNPLNPKRLVLVVHGVQWGPRLQVNHKLDFLPDFIVYTETTIKDGTWFPTNAFLCAGYFDMNWQFSDASIWFGASTRPEPVAGGGAR